MTALVFVPLLPLLAVAIVATGSRGSQDRRARVSVWPLVDRRILNLYITVQ